MIVLIAGMLAGFYIGENSVKPVTIGNSTRSKTTTATMQSLISNHGRPLGGAINKMSQEGIFCRSQRLGGLFL